MPQFTGRPSGRTPEALRPISFQRHFTTHAEGSVLVCFGETKVICTRLAQPWCSFVFAG